VALANSDDPEERRAIESAMIGLSGGTLPLTKAVLSELKKSLLQQPRWSHRRAARRQGPAANAVLFEETGNPDPPLPKRPSGTRKDRQGKRSSGSAQETC